MKTIDKKVKKVPHLYCTDLMICCRHIHLKTITQHTRTQEVNTVNTLLRRSQDHRAAKKSAHEPPPIKSDT